MASGKSTSSSSELRDPTLEVWLPWHKSRPRNSLREPRRWCRGVYIKSQGEKGIEDFITVLAWLLCSNRRARADTSETRRAPRAGWCPSVGLFPDLCPFLARGGDGARLPRRGRGGGAGGRVRAAGAASWPAPKLGSCGRGAALVGGPALGGGQAAARGGCWWQKGAGRLEVPLPVAVMLPVARPLPVPRFPWPERCQGAACRRPSGSSAPWGCLP